MNKNKSKKASTKLVVVVLLAVVIIVGALIYSGVIEIFPPKPTPEPTVTNTPNNPPNPTILNSNGGEYLENGGYVYKIIGTVKNEGGDGYVKVYANLTLGTNTHAQQNQRLFFAEFEERGIEFSFINVYMNFTTGSKYDYALWAEAD